jgi:hypothetical protein
LDLDMLSFQEINGDDNNQEGIECRKLHMESAQK